VEPIDCPDHNSLDLAGASVGEHSVEYRSALRGALGFLVQNDVVSASTGDLFDVSALIFDCLSIA